jgi:uncharacterized RDD family membrane protein YckC
MMNIEADPYQRPDAPLADQLESQPVGFWKRVLASLIDTVLIILITWPILYTIYGAAYFEGTQMSHGALDFLLTWFFPSVAVIVFWVYKSATPGKMAIGAKVVDAKTGGNVPVGRLILRYFGYYVSAIPLGLGLLWVGWDPRKQGWHDKIAGTLVVSK